MSTAMLVNLILSKLRTGRVDFVTIGEVYVVIDYGCQRYQVVIGNEEPSKSIGVVRLEGSSHSPVYDYYSRWIEGVLNGKTRDEQGVLV